MIKHAYIFLFSIILFTILVFGCSFNLDYPENRFKRISEEIGEGYVSIYLDKHTNQKYLFICARGSCGLTKLQE